MESGKSTDLDPRVLAGLREGDPWALEESYRLLGARVYRVSRGLLAQVSDAEDATQEVFLKLFERAGQFDGRARFTTWLHRLTVNHCLHRLERERLRRSKDLDPDLVDDGESPSRVAEGSEARTRVEELLARIPPAHRAVIVLRELEELSYSEIGEVLDIPVGTVMSRLARAREGIARLIPTNNREAPLSSARSAS